MKYKLLLFRRPCMGYFSEKMKEDMMIRGISPRTQKAYLAYVRRFVKYFMISPDKLNKEDIRKYQVYLTKGKDISWTYFNLQVCALKFFYKYTIKKNWVIEHVTFQKRGKILPVVLSKKEVLTFLNAITNIKHYSIFLTMYSTGMRIQEVHNFKLPDIDSDRMIIHIKQGKGRKDRIVMLSPYLLRVLRKYYKTCNIRPDIFFFPGRYRNEPISIRTIQKVFQYNIKKTDIRKKVKPHTLRHSFATHLLEDGVNIVKIQKLLGHNSLKTTEIYTHIAKDFVQNIKSPLDTLLDVFKKEQED